MKDYQKVPLVAIRKTAVPDEQCKFTFQQTLDEIMKQHQSVNDRAHHLNIDETPHERYLVSYHKTGNLSCAAVLECAPGVFGASITVDPTKKDILLDVDMNASAKLPENQRIPLEIVYFVCKDNELAMIRRNQSRWALVPYHINTLSATIENPDYHRTWSIRDVPRDNVNRLDSVRYFRKLWMAVELTP